MSQIKVSPQKPDTLVSMVGSEAKNPLPTGMVSTSSWAEAVGLFWMFIDDPWRIRDYAEYLKRRLKK